MDQQTRGLKKRDIVVIGGSAGALPVLKQTIPALPADLPAAVFIVMHIGENVSYLHQILGHGSAVKVLRAESGQAVEHGRVYIAPPDRHLLLHDTHMLLRRGPHENLSRPAIDPLFRSAAASFGARVIGVVLSGALSDGSAGLRAIKRCNGVTIVQDPQDAEYPSMPRNALAHVDVDHCVAAADLGSLVARVVAEPAGPTPRIPWDIRIEAAIAAQEPNSMKTMDKLGKASRFTCPECGGELWEIVDGPLLRYRCHVGHAFSSDVMHAAQAEQIERKLWELLRRHQERSEFARRRAEHERSLHNEGLSRQFEARARRYEQDAELIRELLRESDGGIDPQKRTDGETEAKSKNIGAAREEEKTDE